MDRPPSTDPPWTALVLAGGRASRLGGRPKPQLQVGDRTMLAAVLAAAAGAAARIVVGPPQPVPPGVAVVREEPPGGGPVAALRAGLPLVGSDVVAVLAADLPFLTTDLLARLCRELGDDADADGAVVVDDLGQDQFLLGAWRTEALRRVVLAGSAPRSMRRLLAPLAVHRLRPAFPAGSPPPWTDCDTPAELARARAAADRLPGGREPR